MEGIALLGVFVMIVMLVTWLLAHDDRPDGKTRGLFAMREPGDARGEEATTYIAPETKQHPDIRY